MNNKAIGIFDSGIGGLTVARAISEILPNERIMYLGDTARVPYGTRGKKVITQFASELTDFILTKDIKCIVIACNTISAVCKNAIQKKSPVKVFDVITPAVDAILKTTKTKRVGVIGTNATIQSGAYQMAITAIDPSMEVLAKACPLFVPIIEEGLAEDEVAYYTAKYYLSDFTDVDTLHLGCTHFPLLQNTVRKVLSDHIQIIDSAAPAAAALQQYLIEQNLLSDAATGEATFYFTDLTEQTEKIAKQFYPAISSDALHHANLRQDS